ncbi:MAG: SMP-30/gluconolactonase/LRE family protein [Solirubrobacteraceae bacterium]
MGEGPAWDERDGALLWIDIVPGNLFRLLVETGELSQITLGQEVSVVIPRDRGGYVVGVQDGLFALGRFDQAAPLVPLAEIEIDQTNNLMNDCKCDARGRLWGGTRARDWTPAAGALYRVDPDLTTTQVLTKVSTSNGLGWNPEFTRMYYIDSAPGTLDVLDYDLETGAATNRRRFADIDKALGDADGLCVDAEGYVWVAVMGASALYRYAPDGSIDEIVPVPTKQPTSCCFGGPDLMDLYVTSGHVDMTDEELEADPHAGGVFVLRPGVKGQPTVSFAG